MSKLSAARVVGNNSTNAMSPSMLLHKLKSSPFITALGSTPSCLFHSSPVLNKFMRVIDAGSELDKRQSNRDRRRNADPVEEAPFVNPEELLSEAEYRASRLKSRLERKNRDKDAEHPYNPYNFTVTIIGRPNVGKSTLFNKLIGRNAAIVDGSSGVTRDWHDDTAQLGGLNFRLIDTAGLEEIDWSVLGAKHDKNEQYLDKQHRSNGQSVHTPFGQALKAEKRSGKGVAPSYRKGNRAVNARDDKNMTSNYALGRPLAPDLQQDIIDLTKKAVEMSDLVIFMVDTRSGITPLDLHFSKWLRKQLTPKGPLEEEEKNLQFNYMSRSVLRSTHTKPVILLANKYDYGSGDSNDDALLECYNLGLGEPIPFSGAHGTGMGELFSQMVISMTSVLKQWDQYQQRVKFIHEEIKKQQFIEAQQAKAALNAVIGDVIPDVAAAEGGAETRRLKIKTAKVTRSSLKPKITVNQVEPEQVSKPIKDTPEGMPKIEDEDVGKEVIKVVVAGKPNVGKSTLVNALLGENRMLTGPQPGVTRDSIAVRWRDERFNKHVFELTDTAGIKGVTTLAHSKYDRVDSMAMNNTIRTIGKGNVVVLVIDVVDGLYGSTGVDPVFASQIHKNFVASLNKGPSADRHKMMQSRDRLGRRSEKFNSTAATLVRRNPEKAAYQDKLTMLVNRVAGAVSKHDIDVARVASEQGKALIILANKIDLLRGGEDEVRSVLKGLETLFSFNLAQNKGVTVIPVSALESKNLEGLSSKIVNVYEKWNNRVNTGLLNRWLRALTVLKPPPSIAGKKFNLKYVTQTNVRPPTFSVFSSRKGDFPEDYKSFLVNSLRDEFSLQGVPIRLHIRTSENPYVENRVLSMAEKRKISRQSKRDRIDSKKARRNKVPSNRLR